MKKRIVILATGGTIAGVGAQGATTGYVAGQIDAATLVAAVPGIGTLADIAVEQVCNKDSSDLTVADWFDLVRRIEAHAVADDADGFVIMHGTDTMEETAYFLDLVLKTPLPVVLTGAMRPATATSADGPLNLYEAVAVAASDDPAAAGVLVVFAECIYDARNVQKTNSFRVEAFAGGDFGALGYLRDGEPHFLRRSVRPETVETEFDVAGMDRLPSVAIAYFAADEDPHHVDALLEFSDGLIVAGAGDGTVSAAWCERLRAHEAQGKPVVICSRTSNGLVALDERLPRTCVSGGTLNVQKARVLLKLALTVTADIDEIARIFETY